MVTRELGERATVTEGSGWLTVGWERSRRKETEAVGIYHTQESHCGQELTQRTLLVSNFITFSKNLYITYNPLYFWKQ